MASEQHAVCEPEQKPPDLGDRAGHSGPNLTADSILTSSLTVPQMLIRKVAAETGSHGAILGELRGLTQRCKDTVVLDPILWLGTEAADHSRYSTFAVDSKSVKFHGDNPVPNVMECASSSWAGSMRVQSHVGRVHSQPAKLRSMMTSAACLHPAEAAATSEFSP